MVDANGIKKASRRKVIIFWPIHRCPRCSDTARLILLGDIFWVAVDPYDVFVSYSSELHTFLPRNHFFLFPEIPM